MLNSVDMEEGLFFVLFQPCCVGFWFHLVSWRPNDCCDSRHQNAFQSERGEKDSGI